MSAGDMVRALDELRAHTSSDAWRRESEIDSLIDLLHADQHASAHFAAAPPPRRYVKRDWRAGAARRKSVSVHNIDEPGL
jgi:hypothetical protein